jgi:RNA polymerase sigma factor (sigma-70 family)
VRTTESMRPTDRETLREMERDLRARLRAHRLSQSFVDRHVEDALQRGVVEYLRAREAGTEIREPAGFVLQAAFRRAIDELRRESRTEEAVEVERLLDGGGDGAPSAEEVALEDMGAAELHAAIDTLPSEERQALCLHYFEELSDARSAKLLYCSERTFRRRLRKALADLAELLGAPAPEPGSHRAIEIGLASWVSLRGARVVLSSHPLEHVTGGIEGVHRSFARFLYRLRSPAVRLTGEGAPERIGAIAGGPAGKVIGGCAGAAVICALSGVVGPGLQLGGSTTPGKEHRRAPESVAKGPSPATRPLVLHPPRPRPSVDPEPTPTAPQPRLSPAPHQVQRVPHRAERTAEEHASAATRQQSEEQQVEEQFSGVGQAASESNVGGSGATGESSSVEQSAPTQSTAPVESAQESDEERQAEEQFRGPLAR